MCAVCEPILNLKKFVYCTMMVFRMKPLKRYMHKIASKSHFKKNEASRARGAVGGVILEKQQNNFFIETKNRILTNIFILINTTIRK